MAISFLSMEKGRKGISLPASDGTLQALPAARSPAFREAWFCLSDTTSTPGSSSTCVTETHPCSTRLFPLVSSLCVGGGWDGMVWFILPLLPHGSLSDTGCWSGFANRLGGWEGAARQSRKETQSLACILNTPPVTLRYRLAPLHPNSCPGRKRRGQELSGAQPTWV